MDQTFFFNYSRLKFQWSPVSKRPPACPSLPSWSTHSLPATHPLPALSHLSHLWHAPRTPLVWPLTPWPTQNKGILTSQPPVPPSLAGWGGKAEFRFHVFFFFCFSRVFFFHVGLWVVASSPPLILACLDSRDNAEEGSMASLHTFSLTRVSLCCYLFQ